MRAKEITQVLNDLTIERVGSYLGLQLPTKGMIRCPLPDHDDKTPSFEVRHHGRRWVCYACNQSGGVIDLVMACRRMEFLEAKRWLAERSGLFENRDCRSPALRQSKRLAQAPYTGKGVAPEEATPDHEIYKALLARAPMRTSGMEYLKGRRLSEAIINRFSIGQMPNSNIVQELVKEYGFDRIQGSGLLTKKSTRHRFWSILPQTAILFPFIEGKEITYLSVVRTLCADGCVN